MMQAGRQNRRRRTLSVRRSYARVNVVMLFDYGINTSFPTDSRDSMNR
jgi:hypothetical protein